MGIREHFSLHCDWCGVEPDPGQEFDSYMEAYQEMGRVSKFEGWLLRADGQLFCPECVADGRARG